MQANGPLLLDLVGHHDHMRAGESAAIINFVSLRCATLVVVMASANTMLRSICPWMCIYLLIGGSRSRFAIVVRVAQGHQ